MPEVRSRHKMRRNRRAATKAATDPAVLIQPKNHAEHASSTPFFEPVPEETVREIKAKIKAELDALPKLLLQNRSTALKLHKTTYCHVCDLCGDAGISFAESMEQLWKILQEFKRKESCLAF
jgi:hypothetical protein